MKISVTNEVARKLLRRLDADQDPEVRDFVAKVEQGLQPGMMLSSDELQAMAAAADFYITTKVFEAVTPEHLRRAQPKLALLLQKTRVREQIEADQRRRGR